MNGFGPDDGILVAVGSRNDDRAAGCEDAEEIEDGQVEFEGRYPEDAIGAGDGEALGEIGDGVARGLMLDGDAFGDAGAAGGVDHVSRIGGRSRLRQARRDSAGDGLARHLQQNDLVLPDSGRVRICG